MAINREGSGRWRRRTRPTQGVGRRCRIGDNWLQLRVRCGVRRSPRGRGWKCVGRVTLCALRASYFS